MHPESLMISRCARCGIGIDDQSNLCSWCNPIVEFIDNVGEAIAQRFGDGLKISQRVDLDQLEILDTETGQQWRVTISPQ